MSDTVQCYICEQNVEMSKIVKHLQAHTDLEAKIAYQKILKENKEKSNDGD